MLTADGERILKKCNIHIIQCDDRVREDVAITSAEDLKAYMEQFEHKRLTAELISARLLQYVEELRGKAAVFAGLKGLLYFTDGRGIYPEKRPVYDTAFVFMEEDYPGCGCVLPGP